MMGPELEKNFLEHSCQGSQKLHLNFWDKSEKLFVLVVVLVVVLVPSTLFSLKVTDMILMYQFGFITYKSFKKHFNVFIHFVDQVQIYVQNRCT